MIHGMVQAYGDPHTAFLEPVQTELEADLMAGKFGGIGVNLGYDSERNVVLYPLPDSPALRAGVLDGDRLLAVDELTVTPSMPADVISAAIRGKVGERVTITIGRPPDYLPVRLEVERAEFSQPSVAWHIDATEPRMGVVEVNVIASNTDEEILQAVRDLQSKNASHFVLDLRNNGGGLVSAGVDIARLFLKEGDVIQEQFRGKDVETYAIEAPGELADIPLVVLVNRNTASASEIIAGALQAHQRAKLIGQPTYGKDTIQLVFPLRDGSSLHVTAAHWWVPGLDFPREGYGLTPDITVSEASDDPNAAINAAIQAFFAP
jgi:carboxyl-terminal processing protease